VIPSAGDAAQSFGASRLSPVDALQDHSSTSSCNSADAPPPWRKCSVTRSTLVFLATPTSHHGITIFHVTSNSSSRIQPHTSTTLSTHLNTSLNTPVFEVEQRIRQARRYKVDIYFCPILRRCDEATVGRFTARIELGTAINHHSPARILGCHTPVPTYTAAEVGILLG
jgi:hypothetical protein